MEPKDKLRRIRTIKGWPQDQCDKFLGINAGRTYSYERGRARIPREFMAPLAAEWGIPVEWIYDGEDTMPPMVDTEPQHVATQVSTAGNVQLMGDLPARSERRQASTSAIPFIASFPIPGTASAWRIGDNELAPIFMKGDLVLVIADDYPRRGTLALIQTGDRLDLYHIVREGDSEKAVKLADHQAEPAEDWRQVGYLTVVRRTLTGGLTLSFECESGLAPDMMTV